MTEPFTRRHPTGPLVQSKSRHPHSRYPRLRTPSCPLFPFLSLTVIASLSGAALAQIPPPPPQQPFLPRPRLIVAQRVQDLGKVLDGDQVNVSWKLENQGDADVVIERIESSCGCTVVQLSDAERTIKPGASLDLKAVFDSTGRRDAQNKTITVHSNDPIEPQLKLELTAVVEPLYEIDPVGLVNFRQVRRGEDVTKTVSFTPSAGHKKLTIQSVKFLEEPSLPFEIEPIEKAYSLGQRIRFSIPGTMSLGPLHAVAIVMFDVDGLQREREVVIRGEVVGELTWNPRVIDATRQPSLPGKKLAPLKLSATRNHPFKITKTETGGLLEVAIENEPTSTEYTLHVTIPQNASPGPFATMLRVHTDLLDQPVVDIPVFGVVAAPVDVEPPVILLRDNGTPAGRKRPVRLLAHPTTPLTIEDLICEDPGVLVSIDEAASTGRRHLKMLYVELNGPVATRRETKLTIKTNLPNAREITIPVVIEPNGP